MSSAFYNKVPYINRAVVLLAERSAEYSAVFTIKQPKLWTNCMEFQNAQPCLLSNYFTGKGQVNIDGEHL